MAIELGLCDGDINTQFAPLAALSAHYQCNHRLQPLTQISKLVQERNFSLTSKLIQVLLSMLTGCDTLYEVNFRLRQEQELAKVWGWGQIADQSTLSRTLDQLSLKQIDELRAATTQIGRSGSQIAQHNWHAYLWMEYDLSGLPCSARAEASQKGYFSGKKTPPDAN